MEETYNTTGESLLSDELQQMIQYTPATVGQRFINFLIDNIFMQYGLGYLTGTLFGYGLVYLFPDYAAELFSDGSRLNLILISYVIALFNYLIYYTICEKVFKGHTLGKLLSGTRAIRQDGGELTFRNALLRSLSRIVPFEPFSAFSGNPWHDNWTKTMVVKTR